MREPAKSFEELLVWQKAHQFVIEVYRLTDSFPKLERFGLTAQFRRAAISIPADIAEGFRKKGKLDKVRFLNISQGSLEECRYYLILSRDLDYANISHIMDLGNEVGKLLEGYSRAILTPNS
jgi:four helix bundle protein